MNPKKKVYFLCMNALSFTPYAYGLLKGYCEQDPLIKKNYEWETPLIKIESIEKAVIQIQDPFILAASCYVWNHNQQVEIGRRIKEKYPRCQLVFGGPHVPDNSQKYLMAHPYIDVLVHGEGETGFKHILLAHLNDPPELGHILNISYRHGASVIKGPKGPGLPRHLSVPSPYLSEAFNLEERPNQIALWETNRGCPHACTFCDWGVRSTNKLRTHDMDQVRQEIDYLAKAKVADIYITDCNFGIIKRDLEIARMLARANEKYGFPRRVRIQFAKKSNQTVLEISKLLHQNEMLWGTTLSMQSVDENVLTAINRHHNTLKEYQKLKTEYNLSGIPTYTELILGLPLESRDSFIRGICRLFDIGFHDDIRVFELALLPNAPLSRNAERKKYGLKTRLKSLRIPEPGCKKEMVEIVFETNTLPFSDWAYALLFAETIQALHNGGYTRFLSIYLNQTGRLDYRRFYDGFLKFMLEEGAEGFQAIKRVKKLISDFYEDPDLPQIQRILTQPDMMRFLRSYNPGRKGWQLWTYIWLWISEHRIDFYAHLRAFLLKKNTEMDGVITDLLKYQQEIMLTPEYNPKTGKQVTYQFSWPDYFFKRRPLEAVTQVLQYADTHMGITHRYELKADDRFRFVNAAIGISYPYTKFRHFFHQPECTRIIVP